MDQADLDIINGKVEAMFHTLTAVLASLPELPAAEAAVRLAIAREEQRLEDAENETAAATAQIRDQMMGLYVDLLHARSKNA